MHQVGKSSLLIFRKSAKRTQVSLKADVFHENQHTFFITSRSVLLIMRSVSDKNNGRENQNTHFMFHNFYLNRAVYETAWKNIVKSGWPQATIWRMHIACWLHKSTNTRSEYITQAATLLEFHVPLTNCFVRRWFCAVHGPKPPLHRHN